MKIFSQGFYNGIERDTHAIMQKLLNPLCGFVQQIGFVYRGSHDPKLFIAGADLSGVHVLQGIPAPKRNSYHIGGGGIYFGEALIKALGESVERYSQIVPHINMQKTIFKSYHALLAEGKAVLDPYYLQFFSAQQFSRPHFPFQSFDADSPISWIELYSLIDNKKVYIPMQLLFVGYQIKKSEGERWLNSAVTTGTATHTTEIKALKSALLELIQLDSAMGHWFTARSSYEIILDRRTHVFEKLLKKCVPATKHHPRFYLLPNRDLKGFVVACVFVNTEIPRHAVGLGADTNLVDALYKALLEAAGVLQLTKIVLLNNKLNDKQYAKITADSIFDLDGNVALYAQSDYANKIKNKFLNAKPLKASEIEEDLVGDDKAQLNELITGLIQTNKDLYHIDLTPPEVRHLNLHVMRVWSPQLLSLALPSAVPKCHPRFSDYGEVIHEDPHPYP